MADDVVVDNGRRRIRVPGSLASSIPRAEDFAISGTDDREVALFFVTEFFTATEIGSGGDERVADSGFVMSLDLFREFVKRIVWMVENTGSSDT